jgi:hypothetical protein
MKPGPTPPAIKTKIVKAIHLAHVLDSKAFFLFSPLRDGEGLANKPLEHPSLHLFPHPKRLGGRRFNLFA